VGLRGAGHEVISRALFGLTGNKGDILLFGKTPDQHSPKAALQAGVGLVARDRTEESVAMNLSIRENTFLNPAAVGRSLLNLLGTGKEVKQAAAIWGFRQTTRHWLSRRYQAAISKRSSSDVGWPPTANF